MFQYAALSSIARERGYDFCIPPSSAQNLATDHQLLAAFKLPRLNCIGWHLNAPRLSETSFFYDPLFANSCKNHVDIGGYFQSEKYFAAYADQVRSDFTFHSAFHDEAVKNLQSIGGKAVSLHIRRGDYVNLQDKHPLCTLAYYEEALATVPDYLPILIFSDDIGWCRHQPLFQNRRFRFSEGRSNIMDLCLMSLCEHHIISNSSFSWWGAWLSVNPDKIVITPKNWFGPSYAHMDTRDLIPETWQTM